MTLLEEAQRFVTFKQKLGLRYQHNSRSLRAFAHHAMEQGDRYIRVSSAVAWASMAPSAGAKRIRLNTVRRLAIWLHAEEARHEIPHRDAVGRGPVYPRRVPQLLEPDQIRRILDAALERRPVHSINPHTYHYAIGLIAATGLRAAEACGLKLSDLETDGLLIRATKFKKNRRVVLHPSTREKLNHYRVLRARCGASNDHLFVLANGHSLSAGRLSIVFRQLAQKTGLRAAPGFTTFGTRLRCAVSKRRRPPIPIASAVTCWRSVPTWDMPGCPPRTGTWKPPRPCFGRLPMRCRTLTRGHHHDGSGSTPDDLPERIPAPRLRGQCPHRCQLRHGL